MKPLQLHTTSSAYYSLLHAADGRGEFTKVRKSDLQKICMDHTNMTDRFSMEIKEAPDAST